MVRTSTPNWNFTGFNADSNAVALDLVFSDTLCSDTALLFWVSTRSLDQMLISELSQALIKVYSRATWCRNKALTVVTLSNKRYLTVSHVHEVRCKVSWKKCVNTAPGGKKKNKNISHYGFMGLKLLQSLQP